MTDYTKCRNFRWKESDCRGYITIGWCGVGNRPCISEPCLFYEEEKDESKRTDKNPADNT